MRDVGKGRAAMTGCLRKEGANSPIPCPLRSARLQPVHGPGDGREEKPDPKPFGAGRYLPGHLLCRPLNKLPAYAGSPTDLPVAHRATKQVLGLLLWPEMSSGIQQHVVEVLLDG